ncbi:bifunctional polysaccharide deacetylase/glycosyltransferase family 2 protein [Yinghuangia seranimata]|uniref:bifunctional polysaccharide deacetylase/glycosyltransferase family 2 protein n=1 Tax=Yinghuangia seranimata TaxID=408067 RepID=UPI00248C0118|nr:bifunctional polysaccharide deacetylase/glycosyltransferase family 2 protein [Yinghuangia seranimata]MDI2132316.1 bifunctional polysaccharide deacetylase/glycosyltransferase family 2 protein [Yinghuangia seranimata]
MAGQRRKDRPAAARSTAPAAPRRAAAGGRPREARAHWVVLVFTLLVAAAALLLDGYARHTVGDAGTVSASADPASCTPAPPEIRDGGPVIRNAPGDTQSAAMPAKTVALTFDDGPDPTWTPRILDVLARHGAKATFFMIGAEAAEHPDLVRRVHDAGHEIGSHTYTHADVGALPAWRTDLELSLTRNAIAGAAGVQVRLMRPPYSSSPSAFCGATWDAVRRIGADGYLVVAADLDSKDWARPGVDSIVGASTPHGGRGAVVMFHDGGGDRAQTVDGLDRLLTTLQKDGYRFTTVSDGLGLPREEQAGTAAVWRGRALIWAQRGAHWFVVAMTWILTAAGVITVLRLVVMLIAARVHVRRVRRTRRRGERPPAVWDPVSVIVPAYNEAAGIEATLRSLVASTHPNVEIIVVDDGSTDETADIAESLGLPGVTVIRQQNGGKASALNTGIAWSTHELIVMIDGDTVFEPDAVHRLVQPFADPAVGAVSGNTKVGNRRGVLGRWQHLEYVIGFNLDRRMFDVLKCMPTVPGAIGAFRREALAGVGGVSEDTLAEDTDLTMALCRSGWRVVYEETALAWTEAPESLRQLWRQRYRWCYGTLQAMWKHRRAVVERGAAGHLGRRGLPYLFLFQVMMPLLAPVVDVFALYGLVFLGLGQTLAIWSAFLVAQLLTALYALHLDHEKPGPLWTLPLQQFVYRQLMYLVVIQSVVTAVLGNRVRWQRMKRTGTAGEQLARSGGAAV